MKKIFKIAGIVLAGALFAVCAACGGKPETNQGDIICQGGPQPPPEWEENQNRVPGACKLLCGAGEAETLSKDAREREGYLALKASAETFAARFAPRAVGLSREKNVAVSPISVYMALALAETCAAGETRAEIQDALSCSHELLGEEIGNLYCGLGREVFDDGGALVSKLSLANSIWIQDSFPVKDVCTRTLAENYYCSTYSADFATNNAAANAAVREYVKEQTRGLIDQDFGLSDETRFTLINSLYLKDVWNMFSGGLFLTEEEHDFLQSDGQNKRLRLLEGFYESGNAFETQSFRHFFAETANGYRLKFLVPKDGFTAEEIFTEENLRLVAGIEDYRAEDENFKYYTRCLFPKFRASYNEKIDEVLKGMGISRLFSPTDCDFGTLSDEPTYCAKTQHVSLLNVDEKGIEGAAVTIMEADTGSPFIEKKNVYSDFVVDRAFGFALTDRYGTTLFSGIVGEA